MLPVTNNTTSGRTAKKVERELRAADKEYAKAEKGYQKGSIRRAEKHENRGMAHELKADGLTVGSRHGHNEATRVAMLHNPVSVAQPTIVPMAAPTTTSYVDSGLGLGSGYEGSRLTSSGDYWQQQGQSSYIEGQRGLGSNDFYQQQGSSGLGQQNLVNQSSLGQQQPTTVVLAPGTTTTITTQPAQRF